MYFAIGVGLALVIFAGVRAVGLSPTRQLFNWVLGVMTLACLVSLGKLWPTHPATGALVAFMLGAGTVGLVVRDEKANFAVLPCYAALLILLNVLTK